MTLSTFDFRVGLLGTLRLLVLASSVIGSQGFAQVDDYAEVNRLIKAGQMTEALAKADQYLASRARDPQMRFLKGVILSESGKPGEAIAVFTKLTEDYPELPEPYNNLAVLYANQNQFDKARSSLEMAIRTNPSYATAHENLGDVYARLASQAYSKALQLDGSNAAVQPKLGLIRNIFNPDPKGQKPAAAPAANLPVATLSAPAARLPAPSVAAARVPAPAAAVASPATSPLASKPAADSPSPAIAAATMAAPASQASTPPPSTPPASASNSSSTDAQQEVDRAVRRWAAAWAEQNMGEYLAAYGSKFETPGKQARAAWEAERRARIVGKKRITVNINDLDIQVNGNEAKARFRQQYSADTLKVTSQKTLDLVKSANRWLIVRETVGS